MVSFLPIFLVLIGSFIGSFGVLIAKKGRNKHCLINFLFTKYCCFGLLFYFSSVIFYVTALRMEQLSVVYPFVSTTFIWTTLFSVKFLKEKMNPFKWMALLGIIIGITLIGFGS